MGNLWHSPKVKYATSTFPITHLIPPKILYNLCFSFLLSITTVPRETENNTYANFFWRWGGGGWGGGSKVRYGKCGSAESEKTLGTGLAYMLVLRWKKAKWRMDHPEWIAWTYTLILFNETNSQPIQEKVGLASVAWVNWFVPDSCPVAIYVFWGWEKIGG